MRKAVKSASEPNAEERHYTPSEVAALWNINRMSVQRLFMNEPGVVFVGTGTKRKSMRIPVSVLQRVHERIRKIA